MAWVLFFDGDCGLCNQSVRRLAHWDKDGLVHYAPLQGELAAKHDLQSHLEGDEASMVLLNEENGAVLIQSDAVLQIMRILGGLWRMGLTFYLIPKPVRDALYRLVARNRHRIGKSNPSVCARPNESLHARLRE